jgi:Flp pilus assembly pilin Flp
MEVMTALKTIRATAGRQIRRNVGRFCADQGAATAIEYAMIAAGVGTFIAATVIGLGSHLKTTFYDKLAALFP